MIEASCFLDKDKNIFAFKGEISIKKKTKKEAALELILWIEKLLTRKA